MDYATPLNADPDDGVYPLSPYWNKDPAIGLKGSYVPADALNGPLFEIYNTLLEADLTPDVGNLTQLAEAINILAKRAAGRRIIVDTTLTVDPGAAAVHPNYHTIQAALDSLDDATIAKGVFVTIAVVAGVHTVTTTIQVDHVHGSRIKIKGAALPGAFPVTADITSNVATTRTAMRAKIPTVLSIQGTVGIQVQRGGLGLIEDVMLDHNGAGSGVPACLLVTEGFVPTNRVLAMGCDLVGASDLGSGITTTLSGRIQFDNGLICWCDEAARALDQSVITLTGSASPQLPISRCLRGLAVRAGGLIRARGVAVAYCSETGARAEEGLIVVDTIASAFSNNGKNLAAYGGRIRSVSTVFGAPIVDYSLVVGTGGYLDVLDSSGGTTSNITLNTVGSNNSYIRVWTS